MSDTMELPPIPDDVLARIDEIQYEGSAGFPVEQGYIWTTCASVENGNPLFWDEKVAQELTGGPIENDQIVCPRHGARFCLRTGAALTAPAYEPVRTFPIRVAHGMVQVLPE